ncbi:MAG: type IX secretion system protein PorQ [Clostridium sp.]|nr:type IX secretion system protein PorQ [Prevotella sp.]MCM1428319.1 type IX secretion system protein PorQ [Clostridium sp.]MCM1474791.1 type IX secretion system protein PorQ [Muribaculaceae bacterium]
MLRHIISAISASRTAVSIFALGIVGLFSYQANAQYGRTAYDFLNIPSSSHAVALGGSAIALIDDDVTLVDQNPALLGPEIDKQVSFNYMLYLSHGNFAGLRYGMAAGEHGAWAAGIRYLNYGSLTRYDHTGVAGDTFKPSDVVFEGTYSHDFTDRLRGGINLKMVYSNYDSYTAFAIAADLGINYYDDEHDMSLSAVLKNAGGQLKRFDKAYNRLPFDIQLGYMQGLGSGPFSLAITATNLTRWRLPYYSHPKDESDVSELRSNFGSNLFRHLIFGLQYQPSDKFYAALSYNYKTRTDMSAYKQSFLSGFSIGLGLKTKHLAFGVAYGQPHNSASNLSLNLTYAFSDLLE